MGANAQTSVPTFTAGEILTAANMNISARTGIPVFADSTARDAAFGGTGEKTLAEGQYAYLESTNATQVYDGSNWVAVGASGLTFITGATFSAVTSFSLPNDTFTSTYRNYKVIIQLTAVTSDADFTMRLRASGSDNTNASYDTALNVATNAGATSGIGAASQTSWNFGESDSGSVWYDATFDLIAPQIATQTFANGFYTFVDKAVTGWISRTGSFLFRSATQFDSLSFISSVASSITGVYRVYGYSES
jgi:hypothetical protein